MLLLPLSGTCKTKFVPIRSWTMFTTFSASVTSCTYLREQSVPHNAHEFGSRGSLTAVLWNVRILHKMLQLWGFVPQWHIAPIYINILTAYLALGLLRCLGACNESLLSDSLEGIWLVTMTTEVINVGQVTTEDLTQSSCISSGLCAVSFPLTKRTTTAGSTRGQQRCVCKQNKTNCRWW